MSHVFKHPKYYKELRKRNKSDQAISYDDSTESQGVRPGPDPQASSDKQQAASVKHQAVQDSWCKLQAPSSKRQASSRKQQAPGFFYPDKVLQRQASGLY